MGVELGFAPESARPTGEPCWDPPMLGSFPPLYSPVVSAITVTNLCTNQPQTLLVTREPETPSAGR